jgi:hypothetical protein
MTSMTAGCGQEAAIGEYRARISVLAGAAGKRYHMFLRLPTGDTTPL